MAEFNQFGSIRPSQSADAKRCAQFEAMLADAVDGSLTAEEQALYDELAATSLPTLALVTPAVQSSPATATDSPTTAPVRASMPVPSEPEMS